MPRGLSACKVPSRQAECRQHLETERGTVMSRHGRIPSLAAALALALVPPAGGESPPAQGGMGKARTDRYGDPLPKGAVARLGSGRLCYQAIHTLAFSPDAKTLA